MSIGSYGYYTAGWCSNCGRRRGPDGRCADCDPWWTSPLMQVGGPLVLFVTLFLLGGATLLQQKSRTATAPPPGMVALSTQGVASPAYPSPSYTPIYAPPVPVAPAAPRMVAINVPLRPSQDDLQFMELEQLRQTTAYVDSVVQAAQNERAQRARSSMWGASPAYRASAGPTRRGNKSMMSEAEYPDNYL